MTREFAPGSIDEAACVMAQAARDRLRVAFVGGGTELGLGRRPEVDATVRTDRMARILEHTPADMVLVAEAGVTLAELQRATREHRQMLALDPPEPERATIGGLVATGAFGPRRARYGAIRDLIIGVTLVRADGIVAHGGGKVVKNVAGFDLPKLACGSLGTLGMIAGAAFRLHPLPEASVTALVAGVPAERIGALLAGVRQKQLEPSSVVALRADGGGFDVGVRFEGFGEGVAHQVGRFADGTGAEPLVDDAGFWRRHDAVRAGGPVRVRCATLPSQLPAVAALFEGAELALYATLGIAFIAGDLTAQAIRAAREKLVAGGGWLIVETASDKELDPWGPVPGSFEIMKQLKQRFDPERRLNPGRFVGGL
jgi:glycolate oxidase FAD binding subunit